MNVNGMFSSGLDTSKVIEALSMFNQQRIKTIESTNNNLVNRNVEISKLDESLSKLNDASRNVSKNISIENVKAMVDSYNETLELASKQTKVELGNNTIINSGVFQGDAVIGRMPMNLKSVMMSEYDETYLSEIGLTLNRNKLEFDEEVFEQALTENPDKVNKIFNGRISEDGVEGVSRRLTSYIDRLTNFDGYLTRQSMNTSGKILSNLKSMAVIESQMIDEEKSLWEKFARMEEAISKIQTQFAGFRQVFGL